MPYKEKKKFISDLAKQLKGELKLSNTDTNYVSLAKAFQNNDTTVVNKVDRFEDAMGRGLTSGEIGMTYQNKLAQDNEITKIEKELIKEKMGGKMEPSSYNLRATLKAAGVPNTEAGKFAIRKIRELVLLDD